MPAVYCRLRVFADILRDGNPSLQLCCHQKMNKKANFSFILIKMSRNYLYKCLMSVRVAICVNDRIFPAEHGICRN